LKTIWTQIFFRETVDMVLHACQFTLTNLNKYFTSTMNTQGCKRSMNYMTWELLSTHSRQSSSKIVYHDFKPRHNSSYRSI